MHAKLRFVLRVPTDINSTLLSDI